MSYDYDDYSRSSYESTRPIPTVHQGQTAQDQTGPDTPQPTARGRRGSVRVPGAPSGAAGKLGSLVMSVVVAAITLVGGIAWFVGLQNYTVTMSQGVSTTAPLLVGVALLVISALFWGAVARMSSLGPTVIGLLFAGFGVASFFWQSLPVSLSNLIPTGFTRFRDETLMLLTTGWPLVIGVMLLGIAFAASLTRRAPRRYHPDAIGL